jgi:two-component system, response regulator
MQERDIRLLFNAGHWSKALIVPYEDGWQVLLFSHSNNDKPDVLTAKRGGPRIFKTSDAALEWCQQIGFESVKVHLVSSGHYAITKSDDFNMHFPILLVEDNEDDIELTRYALERNKIANELIVKRDGAEAIKYLFDEIQKPSQIPSLIILDLHLPKISGMEVLELVRQNEKTNSIPIVVLTTSDLNSDIKQSYKLGTNSYICKPNDIDNFSDVIKRLGVYWTELNLSPPC